MAKILIVENEIDVARGYKKTLKGMGHEVMDICPSTYELAWEMVQRDKPDIVLIDIELDSKKTGKDLGITINAHYGDIAIIFLSKYKNLVEEAWRSTHCIDSIGKGEDNATLERLIERAVREKNKISIVLPFGGHKYVVHIEDILYIEGDSNYSTVKTKPLAYLPHTVFNTSLRLIDYTHYSFIRVHRTFIINEAHITKINKTAIELAYTDKLIPIGNTFKPSLISRLPRFF